MMCSLLLRPNHEKKHGRFYEWSERMFNNTIAFYGRTVKFVLKHQTITLLVTIGTLVATIYLYIVVPKGFFPVQDTGVIMGISDAPESISFAAMAQRQQALAAAILKDKDVESLSSFIGVDGTNTTPNSGRIQINLKSRDERSDDVTDGDEAVAAGDCRRRGHHALHAAGAGPDGGRPRQPNAVSVHAGGCRSQGADDTGRRSWWRN